MPRFLRFGLLAALLAACTQSAPPMTNPAARDASMDGRPSACPAGQVECAQACVDPSTSAAHCGGCGRALRRGPRPA